jgi:hypothetical protein
MAAAVLELISRIPHALFTIRTATSGFHRKGKI